MLDAIARAFAAVPVTEWLAVALAVAYLVLAVRQSQWCWLFAATSSALYLWLFSRSGLAMQAALQFYYIGMAAYGWQAWRRNTEQGGPLSVRRWSPGAHALAIGAIVLATVSNVVVLERLGLARQAPVVAALDAAIAWASVLTTWMVARKVLENWLYWIVIDLAAAALYWTQGLHATAVLLLAYCVIAGRGYVTWRRSMTVADAPATAQGPQRAEPLDARG
jgi:nicotinamide mononucleotide transporter